MKRKCLPGLQTVILFAALAVAASTHGDTNLVQNPEFIQPDNFATSPNAFLGFYANGTTLGPWNITTTFFLDYFRSNGDSPTPNPSADLYWVALTDQDYISSHVTTISQDLGLLTAGTYNLSFSEGVTDEDADVLFNVYPTLATTALTLAGPAVFTAEFLDPKTPGNWLTQTTNFSLLAPGLYTIAFTNNAGFGGDVDSVVIVTVPEASTWTMMGLGAAILITAIRRSKRAV